MRRAAACGKSASPASMRPALLNAGNDGEALAAEGVAQASMRPALLNAGNGALRRHCAGAGYGFNEAGVAQRRKCHNDGMPIVLGRRFNEAGVAQRRKWAMALESDALY